MADDLPPTGAEPSLTEALEANFDAIAAREAPAAGEPAADIFADDALASPKPMRKADTPEPVAEKATETEGTIGDDLNKAFEKVQPSADPEWLSETLSPLKEIMAEHKISAADAIGRLVATEQLLRTDLGAGLSAIIGQYSGQLSAEQATKVGQQIGRMLGGGGDEQDPKAVVERTVRQAFAEMSQHKNQVAARRTVQTFAATRDETGAARYPHFEQAKPAMQGLLVAAAYSGRPLSLEQAYEQAIWSHPELRAGLMPQPAPAPQKRDFRADGDSLGRALEDAFDTLSAR